MLYLFLTGSGSQKNHASGSETLSVTYSQIHQHFLTVYLLIAAVSLRAASPLLHLLGCPAKIKIANCSMRNVRHYAAPRAPL